MNGLLQGIVLPDLWQQEAVRFLRSGADVLVDAPTGAGKTRIFELAVPQTPPPGYQAVFTVPTRALANDKFHAWKRDGWNVGIVTGDVAENLDAPVLVATLETQRERLIRGHGPSLLAVDEYQMLGDPVRGVHYELALALAPASTRLLLLSGSVGNPAEVAGWLRRLGRRVEIVSTSHRPVPLEDLPVEGLPTPAPRSVQGFFPRLAVEAILADLAPLLVFAPQRHTAEKIARQISDALPEAEPLELTTAQAQACDKGLARMLRRRVAYHHSGMSYQIRAGLLEPLARSGQLRVVVATMGLASGIDFSVRSVFVAGRTYFEGPFLREVLPEELLQMFGRAGRRGKDTCGYVLSSEKSPRLSDGRQADLRRPARIDGPAFLRVMHRAAAAGEEPLAAARRLAATLFSREPVGLGLDGPGSSVRREIREPGSGSEPYRLRPMEQRFQNSRDDWEPVAHDGAITPAHAGDVLVRAGDLWEPALETPSFVASATPLGRVCRLAAPTGPGRRYGKELIVATRQGDRPWRLTRGLAAALRPRPIPPLPDAGTVRSLFDASLGSLVPGAELTRWSVEDDRIVARIDLAQCPVSALLDQHGALLIDPPVRSFEKETATSLVETAGSPRFDPPPDSPARAWRELGLLEEDGKPTRRGIIFGFFQHGEGLAIAAALEEEDYPVSDLALHLANLRGGSRFVLDEAVPSERLTLACRRAYGPASYEGYLKLGLPEQYGEGAAEVVEQLLGGRGSRRRLRTEQLGDGDLERALREWMSLLRHTAQAPDHPWPRWKELQSEARQLLESLEQNRRAAAVDPSLLTPEQRNRPVRHRLSLRDFRASAPA